MNDEIRSQGAGEGPAPPSDEARWIAASSYVFFVSIFALLKAGNDPFIRHHARQGFLLFAAEIAAVVLAVLLDFTVGRIRFVGLIVVLLFDLAAGISALTLSVIGFVKALFGEYWSMPFLGEYRDRVPDLGRRR